MKNNFAAEYEKEQELQAAYHQADKAGDEERQDDIRAEHFRLMDSIEAKGLDYAKIFRFYSEAKERGNERIDLSDVVWDKDVEGLMRSFKVLGIEEFTFSSTAWLFTQHGFHLAGILEINSQHKAILSDEYEKVPAYLFKAD